MLTDTVKTKITSKIEGEQKNKPLKIKKQKNTSKVQIIIVSIIITLIAAYVASDILFLKSKSVNKAVIVNQKLDSLQMRLNTELPKIDNAIQVQEQQVKELQSVSKK